MKNYSKPQMMAKNAPTGSYAAGCPVKNDGKTWFGTNLGPCRKCERTA